MEEKMDRHIAHHFRETLELYYEQLELLVFQYGVKPSQMEDFMEGNIKHLYSRYLNDPEADLTKIDMFDETFTTLQTSEHVHIPDDEEVIEDEQGKRVFHFEEDEKIHKLISQLEPHEKLVLILHYFHDFNQSQIAQLLKIEERAIVLLIEKSIIKLKEVLKIESDEQIDKFLKLLNKSYERVKSLTDLETVLSSIQGLKPEQTSQSGLLKKSDHFSIWKPVLLISVIMIFFGSIIFVGETYGKVDDRFLAKMKEEYQEVKQQKTDTLQVKPEAFQQMMFVQEADKSFGRIMTKFKRRITDGEEIKKEEIREEYNKVLESLNLPSEMVKKVIKDPLTDDEQKSEEFFNDYLMRLDEIKYAYYQSLYDPSMASQEQQPKKPEITKELAKAMEEQNLKFVGTGEMDSFPIYLINEQTEKLGKSIHISMKPHIMILEKTHYMFSLNTGFSTEEIIKTLSDFEDALMTTKHYSDLYHRLANVYAGIVMWTVQDSWRAPEDQIIDEDGKVKEKYRELWTTFANTDDQSPLSALFKPIVSEMEESDWTFSQKQEYIEYLHVEQAISYAREGRLKEFSYADVSNQFNMDQYYSTVEMEVGTDSYNSTIQMFYEEFKRHPESGYMGTNDPLYIIGVYELARAEGNVEVIYNLTYKTMPFDDFKEQWQPGPSFLEGVDSIKLDPNLTEKVSGEPQKISIVFTSDGKDEVRVKFVQANYYWLVSDVLY